MKLKSLIISFSVASTVLLLVGGCGKDFLDTPVQNAISSDILASSQSGVEASLISTYKMLNGFTNTVGNTWGSAPSNYIFNSASDDVHKGSEPSDNPDGYYEVALYQWSPGFLVFTHKFQAVYEGVRRANNTIQLANLFAERGGDANEVARIIAEAKFLRTWYHFEAYKMWKNVPYYDETDVDFTKPNNEDIIPKLIADLESAISGLPQNRSQVGRVDKTVAQALLGKIKLYVKDFTGAKTALTRSLIRKSISLSIAIRTTSQSLLKTIPKRCLHSRLPSTMAMETQPIPTSWNASPHLTRVLTPAAADSTTPHRIWRTRIGSTLMGFRLMTGTLCA
jgi:hypothetical protein